MDIRLLAPGDERTAFVLTEPDNGAANALYRSAGGRDEASVQWTFSYAGD